MPIKLNIHQMTNFENSARYSNFLIQGISSSPNQKNTGYAIIFHGHWKISLEPGKLHSLPLVRILYGQTLRRSNLCFSHYTYMKFLNADNMKQRREGIQPCKHVWNKLKEVRNKFFTSCINFLASKFDGKSYITNQNESTD